MITKTFMVDDTPLPVAYSARTTILYNVLFPENDFFQDVSNAADGKDVMNSYYRFAYVGAYMAADGKIADFGDWLDGFDLVSFVQVLDDIWTFMNGNNKTSSKSKKK